MTDDERKYNWSVEWVPEDEKQKTLAFDHLGLDHFRRGYFAVHVGLAVGGEKNELPILSSKWEDCPRESEIEWKGVIRILRDGKLIKQVTPKWQSRDLEATVKSRFAIMMPDVGVAIQYHTGVNDQPAVCKFLQILFVVPLQEWDNWAGESTQ